MIYLILNLRERIFLTEANAQTNSGDEFGFIVDYSPTITPVIGKVKPNNFFLKQRGSGFNSDSDIVLSRGRLAAGTMHTIQHLDSHILTHSSLLR